MDDWSKIKPRALPLSKELFYSVPKLVNERDSPVILLVATDDECVIAATSAVIMRHVRLIRCGESDGSLTRTWMTKLKWLGRERAIPSEL